MSKNLSGYRGDDKIINLTFTNDAGEAVDISDWIIFFTAKEDKTEADTEADVIKVDVDEHTSAVGGLSQIVLDSTLTANALGNYFYDIQVKKKDGTIATVIDGIITFKEDVTRRTTEIVVTP